LVLGPRHFGSSAKCPATAPTAMCQAPLVLYEHIQFYSPPLIWNCHDMQHVREIPKILYKSY